MKIFNTQVSPFKSLLFALVLALGFQCNTASANVNTHLNETFASGATFSGTLTFDNGFNNLLDVDGTLSGGPYGSIPITWAWALGDSSAPSFITADGKSDWMMDGTPASYNYYIELDWTPGANGLVLNNTSNTGSPPNAVNYIDPMISYNTMSTVPEPSTFLLLGAGLGGVALLRKRTRKQ